VDAPKYSCDNQAFYVWKTMTVEIFGWIVTLPEIPSVVWSGICASGIAVLGVGYTDRKNTKRLQQQLVFNQQESERARVATMRKEVYLPLTEAIAKMKTAICQMPLPLEQTQSVLAGFDESMARVSVVASSTTSLLAQRMSIEFVSAFTSATLLASSIDQAKSNAARNEKSQQKFQADYDRIQLEISRFLESATRDDLKFSALQRSQEYARERVEYYATKNIEALERASREHTKYLRALIPLLGTLNSCSTEFLVSVRQELGYDSDVAAFKAMGEESRIRVAAEIERLAAHLEEIYPNKDSSSE
jgi:hypothetical protein